MVENEQHQAPAGGVSRYRKILRNFKSDLIRISTRPAVTLRCGNGRRVGDRSDTRRWPEGVPRPDKGIHQIVEALTRKPELDVTNVFSVAAKDHFFFVVREARRLHLGDP